MSPLNFLKAPFLIVLLTPFVGWGQLTPVCDAGDFSLSPIEASWRTFAPEMRFENPHYMVPPVLDYVTLQDSLFYAQDAVTYAVLLTQFSGKGGNVDAYIDNYIRASLTTAFSLLVAYEWGMGSCMDSVIESLIQVAQEWLPADPHKRIGDASPFYDRFDPKYNSNAALEVQRLCEEAVKCQDSDTFFAAVESAVEAAVVAITADPAEAKKFVKVLSPYAVDCEHSGVCLPPPLVSFNQVIPHFNGTLPQSLTRISFDEAIEDRQLFPLSPKQVEQGIAYYFQSLHEGGGLDLAPSSFGARIADSVSDFSRMKKATSATANTGKFIAGYFLSCQSPVQSGGEGAEAPIGKSTFELFSQGSKNPWVMGFTLLNRMTALVSAVNKLVGSFHEYQHRLPAERNALAPSMEVFDASLRDIEWQLSNIREEIAAAAADPKRLRDSVMLIDAFEDTQHKYDLLLKSKRLADEHAQAAALGVEDLERRARGAAWSFGVDLAASADALMRLSSSVTKSSLKLAVFFEKLTKDQANILKGGLPDAFEKVSPLIGGAISASSVWFDFEDAMGMMHLQSAAQAALSAVDEMDLELQAALQAAEHQDWTTWGAYFFFDILKTSRNILAAALSWGVVEFAAHSAGGHSEIAVARSVIAIWSLTLINAVIPTYWKWTEETASEEEQFEKQEILQGIRDALAGGGDSDRYVSLRETTLRQLLDERRIADEGVINTMIMSQLLYQLISKDSRYAAYILLYRYRDEDADARNFFEKLGLSSDQLDSLQHAPAELWLQFSEEGNTLPPSSRGLEARSIDFVHNKIAG